MKRVSLALLISLSVQQAAAEDNSLWFQSLGAFAASSLVAVVYLVPRMRSVPLHPLDALVRAYYANFLSFGLLTVSRKSSKDIISNAQDEDASAKRDFYHMQEGMLKAHALISVAPVLIPGLMVYSYGYCCLEFLSGSLSLNSRIVPR